LLEPTDILTLLILLVLSEVSCPFCCQYFLWPSHVLLTVHCYISETTENRHWDTLWKFSRESYVTYQMINNAYVLEVNYTVET